MARAPTKGGSDLRALILDYGEVLSLPQPGDLVEAMAATIGVAREEFEPAYWRHRRAYDLGLPAVDYWQRTLELLHVPSTTMVPTLIDLDVRSWTRYHDPMWMLVPEVRRSGVKTAILSNGVPEIMARIRMERPLDALFDAVVVSCELGHGKPQPEIFEVTLSRLGVPAHETLFVDDRAENIRAAENLGLRTFHYAEDGRFGRFQAFLTKELSK
jgi:putative hydrolase of the HAD superfamily